VTTVSHGVSIWSLLTAFWNVGATIVSFECFPSMHFLIPYHQGYRHVGPSKSTVTETVSLTDVDPEIPGDVYKNTEVLSVSSW
jgi:hypothetical protein